MSMLIDMDPVSRSRSTVYDDPDNENGVLIYEETDIEPILAMNAAMRAATDENCRWTKRGGDDRGVGEMVARIPASVYYQLPKDLREDNNALLQWLEQRDQDVFLTRRGRLRRRIDGRVA